MSGHREELPLHLKPVLSCDDLAVLLGISRSAAYRLVRDGRFRKIPHVPHIRISRAEFDRVVNSDPSVHTEPGEAWRDDSPATVAATAWAEAPLSLVGRRR